MLDRPLSADEDQPQPNRMRDQRETVNMNSGDLLGSA